MRVEYRYVWNHHEPVYGHLPYLLKRIRLIDCTDQERLFNEQYLLSALSSDFSENRYGHLDLVLASVRKVERRELTDFEWEGQGFNHHITRDHVRFEHSVFGECPEWPVWCCTLAQYKGALQGYLMFLGMPKSIDTELIVELPDGEPTGC